MMSWEKIGVTLVAGPVAHGSGVYLRIPKKVCQAYDLFTAKEIEFKLERAKRITATATNGGAHILRSVEVLDKKAVRKTGRSAPLSQDPEAPTAPRARMKTRSGGVLKG